MPFIFLLHCWVSLLAVPVRVVLGIFSCGCSLQVLIRVVLGMVSSGLVFRLLMARCVSRRHHQDQNQRTPKTTFHVHESMFQV